MKPKENKLSKKLQRRLQLIKKPNKMPPKRQPMLPQQRLLLMLQLQRKKLMPQPQQLPPLRKQRILQQQR
jgi:hypothetical protein